MPADPPREYPASLIAWDPIRQQAAWEIPQQSGPNGGTLTTAGGLLFQGRADGRFIAYDAKTGDEAVADLRRDALTPAIAASLGRGLATLENGFGYSALNAQVHGGNLGLTGTDPIDIRFGSEVESYNLYAKAVDPNAPPELSGIQVNGEITSAVPGVKAADVTIEPD